MMLLVLLLVMARSLLRFGRSIKQKISEAKLDADFTRKQLLLSQGHIRSRHNQGHLKLFFLLLPPTVAGSLRWYCLVGT
jgi:hypothetical protein